MFNQSRSKLARVRKVGGSSYFGRHKMLVDVKTGMGFWSSIKGFFSKLYKKAAPVVKTLAKDFIQSGKAQDLAKSLISKGTEKLNETITKKFGPDLDRSKLIGDLSKKGAEALTTKGTQLAMNLLDRGLKPKRSASPASSSSESDLGVVGDQLGSGVKSRTKKVDARIKRLLSGSGLSMI